LLNIQQSDGKNDSQVPFAQGHCPAEKGIRLSSDYGGQELLQRHHVTINTPH